MKFQNVCEKLNVAVLSRIIIRHPSTENDVIACIRSHLPEKSFDLFI